MTRTKVGKSIRLYKGDNWNFVLDKTATALVVGLVEIGHTLPDGSINNDWCNHLIVQDSEGNITDTPDYKCVVCPDNEGDETTKIWHYLEDNGLYVDNVYVNSEGCVEISISWGDWKHEHGWCDSAMRYIGYGCDDEVVTEENGSDCYSAIHFYSKN